MMPLTVGYTKIVYTIVNVKFCQEDIDIITGNVKPAAKDCHRNKGLALGSANILLTYPSAFFMPSPGRKAYG